MSCGRTLTSTVTPAAKSKPVPAVTPAAPKSAAFAEVFLMSRVCPPGGGGLGATAVVETVIRCALTAIKSSSSYSGTWNWHLPHPHRGGVALGDTVREIARDRLLDFRIRRTGGPHLRGGLPRALLPRLGRACRHGEVPRHGSLSSSGGSGGRALARQDRRPLARSITLSDPHHVTLPPDRRRRATPPRH